MHLTLLGGRAWPPPSKVGCTYYGAGVSSAGRLEAARASVAGRAAWDSWASMAALNHGYIWSGSASDATYGTRAAGASGASGEVG